MFGSDFFVQVENNISQGLLKSELCFVLKDTWNVAGVSPECLRAGPSSPCSTPACRVEALGPPALILRSPMSCVVSFITVAFSFIPTE